MNNSFAQNIIHLIAKRGERSERVLTLASERAPAKNGLISFIFGAAVFIMTALPLTAAAGSVTYSTPGTYTFTVPFYSTLTVQMWGGGGGGGGHSSGWNGGYSQFYGVTAYGGSGAPGFAQGSTSGGAAGNASGGDYNYWGNAGGNGMGPILYTTPNSVFGGNGGASSGGGGGGRGTIAPDPGDHGGVPGGGGGGAGTQQYTDSGGVYQQWGWGGGGGAGYAQKTFTAGALPASVTVYVGAGGAGGPCYSGPDYVTAFHEPIEPCRAPAGGNGGDGQVVITWIEAAPTCSVSFGANPINSGSSTSLTWASANSSLVYITNVGWVAASGSTTVAPSSSTSYNCYGYNPTYGAGSWNNFTLTVYASCALPWGGTIQNGQSVTAYQRQNVGHGQSCTSETRTCTNGTLSGSYRYQSCTVASASNCTLDGVTVNHGDSRTFYNTQTALQGETCSSGDHSLSRTCTDGTLSGSSAYQYANCQCTSSSVYTCSPQNVVRTDTNSACAVSITNPYQTCTSPAFCSAGSAVCLYPSPDFGANGHLRVSPSLIIPGNSTKLFWSVTNVASCSVTGTNGNSFSGSSSPSGGQETSDLFEQTTFTLSCAGLDSSTITESVTVNLVPAFEEL